MRPGRSGSGGGVWRRIEERSTHLDPLTKKERGGERDSPIALKAKNEEVFGKRPEGK